MNDAALPPARCSYTNKAFWRNPAAAFFTFAFPLMFLVIFTTLLGNGDVPFGAWTDQPSTYYVASMAAFASSRRVLHEHRDRVTFTARRRHPEAHPWHPAARVDYLAARVIHAIADRGVPRRDLLVVRGRLLRAAAPPGGSLAGSIVTVLVGAASFSAFGLALSGSIPNADAAPAIVNATILPLLFLSGVFILVGSNAPRWVDMGRQGVPRATPGRGVPRCVLREALLRSSSGATSSSWRSGCDRRVAVRHATLQVGAEEVAQRALVRSALRVRAREGTRMRKLLLGLIVLTIVAAACSPKSSNRRRRLPSVSAQSSTPRRTSTSSSRRP